MILLTNTYRAVIPAINLSRFLSSAPHDFLVHYMGKLRRLLGCYFRVFKTTCQDNQDKFAPWYPCELQLPEYIFNEVIPHLHTHCCFLYLYCVFIYFFQEMLIKILFSEIAFIRLLKKMK